MTQLSPMQEHEIRELLDLACRIYTSMEQVYLSLDQQQLTDTELVSPLLDELEELKEKAQATDALIIEQLEGFTPSQSITAIMARRKEKIQRLIELNKKLTSSAERYKAVIQNERSNLHRNQTALHGYKVVEEKVRTIKGAY